MKNLINNDNKSNIPSYTPQNINEQYTPTMPTTLSAVDTATIPKQNLLGMPNTNIDPLMLNNMAPINSQMQDPGMNMNIPSYTPPLMQGMPNMPLSPMQGMSMNAPPMPGMPMSAPPMPGMPMNAPPMPGMHMNTPSIPMNAPPMSGMPMNTPSMPMNAPPMPSVDMGVPPMQGGKIPDYTKCELIPSYTN